MSRFITCGLTILLAFAPAALAVDGTVLINQSTIINGLPGCPTGGHFPIVICQSGSYRLSGNLTVPDANTTAITISTDTVALDLNGFTIQGPAKCLTSTFPVQCSTSGFGTGIFSDNSNVAVSNGAIIGMGAAGIRLLGTGERIDGLRVASNAGNVLSDSPRASGGGILITAGNVTNCMVTGNALHGIWIDEIGTANLNVVNLNGGIGITGPFGGAIASNNTVTFNGQDGLNNVGLAVNNIIFGNVGFGLSCGDDNCSFEGNAFRGNRGGVTANGTSLGHNSSNGSVF